MKMVFIPINISNSYCYYATYGCQAACQVKKKVKKVKKAEKVVYSDSG